MRSETKLRESYLKQKAVWENSKSEKIKNIESSEKQVSEKIQKLQSRLTELQLQREKLLSEDFQSFETFFRRAEVQSNSKPSSIY